jgi:alkylresorcinol/alkylpyrone synthase
VSPVVRSLATAAPPLYVTGPSAFEALQKCFDLGPEERELYRRLLVDGPIRGRHIGMDTWRDAARTDPDSLNDRFLKFGRLIAGQAAARAIEQAGLAPGDIGGLVTNTCTGYLCPGISSYLAGDLGLPDSVHVFDLMGMGCGAAIPNLQCAAGTLAHRPGGPVLSVSFEVCSATLFMGPEPDLIVSNSLFGDGAAAAVVDSGGGDGNGGLFALVDFESALFPQHREQLRYRTRGGRLRNVLSTRVPVIGARAIASVTERLLRRHKLRRGDIRHWAVHAGGTLVLDRVARQLALPADALRHSYAVLREYGNVSSPSVLFVLRRILDADRPRPKDRGLILSFGAGFTAFAALIEFA